MNNLDSAEHIPLLEALKDEQLELIINEDCFPDLKSIAMLIRERRKHDKPTDS